MHTFNMFIITRSDGFDPAISPNTSHLEQISAGLMWPSRALIRHLCIKVPMKNLMRMKMIMWLHWKIFKILTQICL